LAGAVRPGAARVARREPGRVGESSWAARIRNGRASLAVVGNRALEGGLDVAAWAVECRWTRLRGAAQAWRAAVRPGSALGTLADRYEAVARCKGTCRTLLRGDAAERAKVAGWTPAVGSVGEGGGARVADVTRKLCRGIRSSRVGAASAVMTGQTLSNGRGEADGVTVHAWGALGAAFYGGELVKRRERAERAGILVQRRSAGGIRPARLPRIFGHGQRPGSGVTVKTSATEVALECPSPVHRRPARARNRQRCVGRTKVADEA
jgi:hypothetical protein